MSVKWILVILICLIQSGFSENANHEQDWVKNHPITGHFEGNEPFWSIEIKNNIFILHCNNDSVKDTLFLSKKQAYTETYAFRSKKVFGIIRKSSQGCNLDITEAPNPAYEIYFSFNDTTYMGCGSISLK